ACLNYKNFCSSGLDPATSTADTAAYMPNHSGDPLLEGDAVDADDQGAGTGHQPARKDPAGPSEAALRSVGDDDDGVVEQAVQH
ncbi:MAG: hypothetical protein ACRD0J_01520, partial [Acidimicrobiales bacterium]